MKQDTLKNLKAQAFEWVTKGLIAILCFYAKETREDVKKIMAVIPGLQAKVEMLTDQRLLDRFRIYQVPPGKQEDEITYDSLKRK